MRIPEIKIGDELVCTVCGEKFKVTEDTKYIIRDGYTCSWKCFLAAVRNNTK